MRRVVLFALTAALTALSLPALAGDCLEGFSCDHVCPLAREASNHRSAGLESVAKAPSLRAALAAGVERNLRRI